MREARKSSKKILFLTAAALIAAVCGIWLLLTPYLEREYVASIQDAMIEDMMREINGAEDTTELPEIERETQRIVDITITEGISFTEDCGDFEEEPEAAEYLPAVYEPVPVPTPVFFPPVMSDPIPGSAFPNNIAGIGILAIDSIDLRLPIAEGIEYASLRIAPGRVPQSAQVGDVGNAVIAGHRNYAYGSMFNRLGEVEIGDLFRYQARNGELMEFEVFEIAVIEPQDQIAFIQPVNESIITLYTCTPVRVATHRLIIRAQRIS